MFVELGTFSARVLVFLAGLTLTGVTVYSVIQTFILPRNVSNRLTQMVFIAVRLLFVLPLKKSRSYAARDRVMAYYAPIGLLTLLPVWYLLITLGYAMMYWSLGMQDWMQAFFLSGSSLLTLGFSQPVGLLITNLVFTEAVLGLILVALLIAYLPTMYSAFQRREAAVTMLEVRAGNPPSAIEMLQRYQRIHGLQRLGDLWSVWEIWFADIDESHTSLPALVFFRSPSSDHSWITAAGAILDGASLTLSVVDIEPDPQAMLSIRAGFLALRHIADFFDLPYHPDPQYPEQTISIRRAEFDEACRLLAEAGVPLKSDREQAWRDFAGWRVNYDQPLIGLCSLTLAPLAPWSSDRAVQSILPPILAVRAKKKAKNSQEEAQVILPAGPPRSL